MADRRQKPNLPKKLIQGKTGRSQDAKTPSASGGGGGRINTNFQAINWTPKKLIITIAVLGIPYLIAIIGSFRAGSNLIGGILLSLGVFVGLLYLALRFIEEGDF